TPALVIVFVPTALELAGVFAAGEWNGAPRPPLPSRRPTPIFDPDISIPREYIYWHPERNRALRKGDWKLVCEKENGQKWELYNLQEDRIESRDFAAEQPERVRQMSALWQQLDEEFQQQGASWPATAPARR